MKLFLAGVLQNMNSHKIPLNIVKKNNYFLESFYTLQDGKNISVK